MTRQAKTTQQLIDDGHEVLLAGTSAGGNIPVTQGTALDPINDGIRAYNDDYSMKYQDAPANDVVIKASAGYLKGIIIGGLPIADASIEISDHASDGDGNIVALLQGGDGTDALLEQTLADKYSGYIPVEAVFTTGITINQIAQFKCTYIYR